MSQLTLLEKMQVLFKLLFSSPIIIGIFAFSMILMIILFFSSRLNKKIIKYVFIGIYVLIIGFAVVKYGSYFLTSIDSFFTLFMANIYFPIIPVYVVIMFISFIIMFVTLNSNKNHRIVKIINIVFFTFIQMLFALFIYIVESNKIDLSTNTNLYTNEQTLTLLELGMGLFVVWIVILFIIFYLKKADKIFKTKKAPEQDDFDEYINDYNEPKSVSNVNENTANDVLVNSSTSFNDNIVQALVPEIPIEDNSEEILSFEPVNNSFNGVNEMSNQNNSFVETDNDKKVYTTNSSNVFDNFQFLDTKVERKNEDVEIIDFDL